MDTSLMPVDASRCFNSQLTGNVTLNSEHMPRIDRIRAIESELADRGLYPILLDVSFLFSLPSQFPLLSSTSRPLSYSECACLSLPHSIYACIHCRTGSACARLQQAQQIVQTVFDEVLAGKLAEDETHVVTRKKKGEGALALDEQAELVRKVFRRLKAQDEEFRDMAAKHGNLIQMHTDVDSLLAEALAKCGKVCRKRRGRGIDLVPKDEERERGRQCAISA